MASKEVFDLLKDFKALLVCRICQVTNTHHLDWYRCAHLHPICEICRWSDRCSCGQEILKAHDKLVKSLLSNKNMPYECNNKSRGCQEVLADHKLKNHEENDCIFRPVNCPNCNSRLAFNRIGNVQLFVNLIFILYARWRFRIVCLQTKLALLEIRNKM